METVCAVCGVAADGLDALAEHLIAEAGRSDVAHVMWLNRNVTKHRVAAPELTLLLRRRAEGLAVGEERVQR